MLTSIIHHIESSKNNIIQFTLLNKLKTGNPFFDTFFTSLILGIFSFVISWLYDNKIEKLLYNLSFDDLTSLFIRKSTIILEGRRTYITASYTYTCNISAAYSDRFKAIWYYIINNIDKNDSVQFFDQLRLKLNPYSLVILSIQNTSRFISKKLGLTQQEIDDPNKTIGYHQ